MHEQNKGIEVSDNVALTNDKYHDSIYCIVCVYVCMCMYNIIVYINVLM